MEGRGGSGIQIYPKKSPQPTYNGLPLAIRPFIKTNLICNKAAKQTWDSKLAVE